MRYIPNLTAEQEQSLRRGHAHGKGYQFCNRCQAILLSSQGYVASELAAIFQVRQASI